MLYTKIVEYCDYKGEKWFVFLKQDGNEDFIEKLEIAINLLDTTFYTGSYINVLEKDIPENEVDILIKHNVPFHNYLFNKINKIINPNLIDLNSEDDFYNSFYDMKYFK